MSNVANTMSIVVFIRFISISILIIFIIIIIIIIIIVIIIIIIIIIIRTICDYFYCFIVLLFFSSYEDYSYDFV